MDKEGEKGEGKKKGGGEGATESLRMTTALRWDFQKLRGKREEI